MISSLANNVKLNGEGAELSVPVPSFALAKLIAAVQSIHSAVVEVSRFHGQQFKALYKMFDFSEAVLALPKSKRCIHEA